MRTIKIFEVPVTHHECLHISCEDCALGDYIGLETECPYRGVLKELEF